MTYNYQSMVAEALDFIELNLQDQISVNDVCGVSLYSSWQFQRIFKAFVGDSIGSYLRIRRLTEAANSLLRNPNQRILDVAVAFQFGSQEAFARAFKGHFGVSPSEIKHHKGLLNLKKKPLLNINKILQLEGLIQAAPKIVDLPKRHFVGLEQTIYSPLDASCNCTELVLPLWKQFNELRKLIPHRVPGKSFGIGITDDGSMASESLIYFSAVEVSSVEVVPEGMKALTLPSQKYASFELKVASEVLSGSLDYIYGVWLPSSGLTRSIGYDIEVFSNDSNFADASATLTYYLPVD